MELTEEQRIECWKKRAHKVSWNNIAKPFHVTAQTLRFALNPEAAQHRQMRRLERDKALRRAGIRKSKRNIVHFELLHHFPVPGDILEERDRRQAVSYSDLTSEFFGDPKPGCSALDKKRAEGLWK